MTSFDDYDVFDDFDDFNEFDKFDICDNIQHEMLLNSIKFQIKKVLKTFY